MARPTRTPAARLIVAAVVLLVIVVSVVSFKKRRGSAADQSKTPASDKPSAMSTAPAATQQAARPPFHTETPGGPTTRGNGTSADNGLPPVPRPAGDAAVVIADAKAKVAAGDLLAARQTLNDALLGTALSAADAVAVKREMADDVSSALVFSPRRYATDPLGGTFKVEPGNRLQSIANKYDVTVPLLMDLNRLSDPKRMQAGQVLKIIHGPFHAVVSKSAFTIDLYLGNPGGPGSTYVTTFPVGLGTESSTPTGTWLIGVKTTNPSYTPTPGHPGEPIKGGDPKNPIGPYWLALQGVAGQAVGATSYGIHGTIDPDSIGKMSSEGCIRLRNEDVATVYKLLITAKSQVVVKE